MSRNEVQISVPSLQEAAWNQENMFTYRLHLI